MSRRPQHAFSERDTRVLLAVIALRRPTVRGIARQSFYSIATVHAALCVLRDEGLVGWDPAKQGTIRAKVAIARA